MKKIILCALLVCSIVTRAQQPLSQSTTHSALHHVYKVTDKEALKIFRQNKNKEDDYWPDEDYLHTPATTYPVGQRFPASLPPGNYVDVYAYNNDLRYAFYAVKNVQMKLVSNNYDLAILLHDRNGRPVSDARVIINKRSVPWNGHTQTYRIPRYKRTGIVQVYYHNVLNIFDLSQPRPYKTRWWKKIFSRHHQRPYRPEPDFWYSTETEKHYKGFLTFSKPMYKPNDTLRLKAFIVNNSGKPVNEPLLLRLSNKWDKDTIISTINPYRPGGYDFEMVLNDSLDLDLDQDYLFTLESASGNRYMLADNDSDLDDREYAAKRKVKMRGTFRYEEYELKTIRFTARTDHKEHTRGTPVSLYLKATDENNLPVMDGRVVVTVTPNNIRQYHAPMVFIPDVLWTRDIALEPAGETKVVLPDSIFPAASFSYTINCQLLNSNNESQENKCIQQYSYNTDDISFLMTSDSLAITYNRSGTSIDQPATLLLLNDNNDTVATNPIRLPALLPVHPFVATYQVTAAGISNTFRILNNSSNIQCNAVHTRDSVFAEITNPRKLFFWYSIFAGKKLVAQGYDQQLSWKAAAITPAYYFVSLQYVWNDYVIHDQFVAPYMEKQLQVGINNPLTVYPGQTARIGITVNDINGRPVPDADVTAWAATTKFSQETMPSVPYLGKKYAVWKAYARQQLSSPTFPAMSLAMTWERWRKEMNLDSIAYYHFLHPDGIYYNREPAKDQITQVAPYVVSNGILQRIAYLKIDGQPVYFHHTNMQPAYSFAAFSGWHRLECRIYGKKIIVDSVYLEKGMKNYISIAANVSGKNIQVIKTLPGLEKQEITDWNRYLIYFYVKNPDNFTYLRQDANILRFENTSYVVAGPLKSTLTDYIVKGGFTQRFMAEPGYSFDIQPGLIKEKEDKTGAVYASYFQPEWNNPRLYDHVITDREMDSLWQDYRDNLFINQEFFTETETLPNASPNGLVIEPDTAQNVRDIRQLLLYRYDDPSFIRIYPPGTTRFRSLEPGYYRLLVLLKKNRYYVNDSLKVNEGGHTFFRLNARRIISGDSTSIALEKAILEWRDYRSAAIPQLVAVDFTMPFNRQYLDTSTFRRRIYGVVSDEKGKALPGVSVLLKGTRYGALTDAQGRFSLATSKKGTISISCIGYESRELPLKEEDFFDIHLPAISQHLEEIVVTGYGIQHKKALVGSTAYNFTTGLAGQVAGVNIRGRNNGSTQPPLIIIDGIPYEGNLNSLDSKLLKEITVLKDDAATALYGARASNGVMLITSGKSVALAAATGDERPGSMNSLRSNFRDDAFWQPRLRTNEKGEAVFNVTFPDDITNWKTNVIAFTGQGQTGTASVQIKSYKPLSANLALPAFAVAGDSINIIGKVLNYGKDSTTVSRSFYKDNQLLQNNSFGVQNSRIDTFPINVTPGDSVSFKYTISGRNNYFDGEYRAIPVFEQGVKETKGVFAALGPDTSFTFTPAADTGTVHLYASTGMLPVLLDEIAYLQRYEYLCNEQLASKLTGLLLEQQAMQYLGQPFKNSKKIKELIRELEQNKNKDGGWGWWNKTASTYWISLHVTKALLMAEKAGFTTRFDKAALTNYYVFLLNTAAVTDKITVIETLQLLEAKLNYAAYLDTLHVPKDNRYDQFRLLYLKQRTGMHVSTDSLMAWRHTTMMGNSYWGEESYHLFNNSVQLTLLAYKILRGQGGQEALLRNIRGWFMENRHSGNWRNTYESAAILATIMPDVLTAAEQLPATLTVNGQHISSFPYSSTVAAGQPVRISKQGGASVYFTAWQQYWNTAPQKAGNQFSVSSRFLQKDTAVSRLTAGRAVTMEVVVDVKANAEYVMVEIPVPAGCSYDNKNTSREHNEIHREYFKNKVNIFSNYLSKGKHTFTVSLMPRYTGYYHVNPAKAEIMYFPVFFGREAIKQLIISGK
ncbi:alpha-2-macroglobulin family protein [Chitinophaga sp. 22321]|uniref:Carboxypeptidase-like regulatory domain-containing protein n=1 Tax=Chitinophaga hostae TaxID=2831022 RepID=A0ABS5J165_9BACT|nr:alpha-2-macroglobulin family protein [Chitinophaga hostae]MBS0028890.1 carboxypeptidase-like regulatory domain-containing protein [Chitinophaga hostae]